MTTYIAAPRFALHLVAVDTRVSVPDWRSGSVLAWTNGTVTEVRGTDVDPTGCFIVRLDSTGKEALYFGYSIGEPAGDIVYPLLVAVPSESETDAGLSFDTPSEGTRDLRRALVDIESQDPDGQAKLPLEEDHAAHTAWAIRTYGPAVWAQYRRGGWGEPDAF